MTTSMLPASLQPWREWLEWFSPEIALMLGDCLLKLNPLLGPSPTPLQNGLFEPDGIDDLRQRGPYERLVLSEWVLADTMPEEFLRRAVQHEHLFLSPRMLAPQINQDIVAIFDTGPMQLGAARLVHIAMWILLARRAQSSGGKFFWGVVHTPGVLHQANSESMLVQLLHAHQTTLPSAQHWQDWNQLLAVGPAASQLWLLSGPSSRTMEGYTHLVCSLRGLDEGLQISIGPRAGLREVNLTLPSNEEQAAALLKGQFLQPTTTEVHFKIKGKFSLQQPPLINLTASHVATPLLDSQSAVVLRVQNRPSKNLGTRYHRWAARVSLIAAVLNGKSFGAILNLSDRMQFWQLGAFRFAQQPPEQDFTFVPGRSRWLQCVFLNQDSQQRRIILLDHAGRLLTWSHRMTTDADINTLRKHTVVATDTLALVHSDAYYVTYVCHKVGYLIVGVMYSSGKQLTKHSLAMPNTPKAAWLCGKLVNDKWIGQVCVELQQSKKSPIHSYKVFEVSQDSSASREYTLDLPDEFKVVGWIRNPSLSSSAQILALRKDKRRLTAIDEEGQHNLHIANASILTCSVSADGEVLAYVNLDGQLVVLGEGGQRLLMCVSGDGADA